MWAAGNRGGAKRRLREERRKAGDGGITVGKRTQRRREITLRGRREEKLGWKEVESHG